MEDSVKVGIALSGGGARGIAHIGVLRALEENDIRPSILSGTSAGAIIGALYAAGLDSGQMLDFVKEASLMKIFKVGNPYSGFSKLTYLRDRLARVIPADSFESLQKKLYVAVTNLNTGRLETFDRGPLFQAVMASSAIPLVFQPVEINGQWYVDGGLLENLPIRPLVHEAPDLIIGVNVMPLVDATGRSIQSVVGIATRCFDLAIQANSRHHADLCDVYLEPFAVHRFHIFQFNKYRELYEIGYKAALERMPEIREQVEEVHDRRLYSDRGGER